MTEDRNRLDDAVRRAAEAALDPSPPRSRAASFAERLGPTLGPLALAHEQARQAAARAKFDRLSAALATARKELEQRTVELARELEPLEREMNAQRDVWLRACEVYEAKRRSHQSAVMALQSRLAELVAELNTPADGYGHRVKQWQARHDLPKAPRDDAG